MKAPITSKRVLNKNHKLYELAVIAIEDKDVKRSTLVEDVYKCMCKNGLMKNLKPEFRVSICSVLYELLVFNKGLDRIKILFKRLLSEGCELATPDIIIDEVIVEKKPKSKPEVKETKTDKSEEVKQDKEPLNDKETEQKLKVNYKEILDKFNNEEIDKSVIKYYEAIQRLIDELMEKLNRFEGEKDDIIREFNIISLKLS
ncbi:MAG: hypothetical protein ACRC30_14365, partial [Clostridium sp.]